MVMSSVLVSCDNQRRYDSATTLKQASWGSSNFDTMSTTLWLVRNSHTPSEAMIRNGWDELSCLLMTSGSAKTPILSAADEREEVGLDYRWIWTKAGLKLIK